MDRDEINNKAEELLKKAESGDKEGLAKQLDNIPFRDRLEIARSMQEQAKQAHEKDGSLPLVEIKTVQGSDGEHLAEIDLNHGERSYFNPARWFGDKYSKEDVYDPEVAKTAGTGQLFTALDTIKSQNIETNNLIAEMNRGR